MPVSDGRSSACRKIKTDDCVVDSSNAPTSSWNLFGKKPIVPEPKAEIAELNAEIRKKAERGDTGRLHDVYAGMFREWIRNECLESRYKSPSIKYVEFDKMVKLSSWHAFRDSSWPDISRKIEECWGKMTIESGEDSFQCKIFYKAKNGFFLPEREMKSEQNKCPGKYHEMAVFMREHEDWSRCRSQTESKGDSKESIHRQNSSSNLRLSSTRKYAQFQHGESANLTRQCCALLCLELDERNKPSLRFYSYNVSTQLFEAIKEIITQSLKAQAVRYEFLISVMKLKLGLCHELHHRYHFDPSDLTATTPNLDSQSANRPSKTSKKQKTIELEDIIHNKIAPGAVQKRFGLHPFLRIFQEGCDCIPKVELGADPVRNHAGQFGQVKARTEHRMGTVGNEEQGLQTMLKEWFEITVNESGDAPEPPNNFDDVKKIKDLSKVVFFTTEDLFITSKREAMAKSQEVTVWNEAEARAKKDAKPTQNREKMRPRLPLVTAADRAQHSVGITPRHRRGISGIPNHPVGHQKAQTYEEAQRQFLFAEIGRYFKCKFAQHEEFSIRPIRLDPQAQRLIHPPILSAKKVASVDSDGPLCKYFQLCRREQSALLIEVRVIDSASCLPKTHSEPICHSIGRVKLSIFSLNLNLLDTSDCYDFSRGKSSKFSRVN